MEYDNLSISNGDLENFDAVSDWGNAVRTSFSAANGRGTLTGTVASPTYGWTEKTVSYNVDVEPELVIHVESLSPGAGWALKVDDGSEKVLENGSTATGVFRFNLKSITGWSGQKTFKLRLFVTGGLGKSASFDYIHKDQRKAPLFRLCGRKSVSLRPSCLHFSNRFHKLISDQLSIDRIYRIIVNIDLSYRAGRPIILLSAREREGQGRSLLAQEQTLFPNIWSFSTWLASSTRRSQALKSKPIIVTNLRP